MADTDNYDFTALVLVQENPELWDDVSPDQKRSSRVGMSRVEPPLQGLCLSNRCHQHSNPTKSLSQFNGMISENEPGNLLIPKNQSRRSTERTAHTEVVSWANNQTHCRGDTVGSL